MPQLGETVTEGTITRWFKQVGDQVAVDEPLFEVSTDKVDSEVPSPAAGELREILVGEGETVEVGARLAVLGDAGAAPTTDSQPRPDSSAHEEPRPEPETDHEPQREPEGAPEPAAAAEPEPEPAPEPAPEPEPASQRAPRRPSASVGAKASTVTSPIVRRLIDEHGLDPASIDGTGEGGRITRRDVLGAAQARRPTAAPSETTGRAPGRGEVAAPPPRAREGEERIPFDNVRLRTAEHMVRSKATSAHVYTSVEVDFERVEHARRTHQAEWRDAEGFSLTYLPFISRAVCDAIIEYPKVNASIDADALVVHHSVHLAIAVDLDFEGLLAPVIRDADGKRLWLLAREIRDLAQRARSRRLSPDEVLGGTFTITNPGPFGSFMTLAIINQPQVAILSTDGIAKRPVVVEGPDGEDAIAVHHTGLLALAWDHRAFDGAYASSFLRAVKDIIEHRDWVQELA